MRRWLEALMACDAFRQQMNPFNGAFNTTERYSPSMLVLTDFIARRHGVKYAENGILWGTASVPQSAAHSFETRIGGHRYRLEHQTALRACGWTAAWQPSRRARAACSPIGRAVCAKSIPPAWGDSFARRRKKPLPQRVKKVFLTRW
mgnify:CR=1 FL=1